MSSYLRTVYTRGRTHLSLAKSIQTVLSLPTTTSRSLSRSLGPSLPLSCSLSLSLSSSSSLSSSLPLSSTRPHFLQRTRAQTTAVADGAKMNRKKRVVEKQASINVRTNEATLRPKAAEISSRLAKLYPDPPIPLNHESGYQLLVAVVLSAQTTDVKVNEVTPELFRMGPDALAMSKCDVKDIERAIGSLGLAPTKAKNVRALSAQLVEEHGGVVPKTFEELEALPGVGHKTASVVMSQVHGLPSFAVDTHIHRLAQRWGLTDGSSVEQTEADLKFLFEEETWNALHLQIIYFGREFCPARGHDPAACPLCSWAAVHPYDSMAGTETTKSPQGKRRVASKRGGRGREGAGEGESRTKRL